MVFENNISTTFVFINMFSESWPINKKLTSVITLLEFYFCAHLCG